jgi:N utilization substance protein B
MPAIDRALLRVGCYELLYEAGTPTAVIINEAVELATRFSTDDSGRFVNGVLSKLADIRADIRSRAVPHAPPQSRRGRGGR